MAFVAVLVAVAGYVLICGWVCASIARKRGLRENGWWLTVGIIVGPIDGARS
jgi:hypothetical protein